eukprot:15175776-Alexandrium_andersonii.AAC.1
MTFTRWVCAEGVEKLHALSSGVREAVGRAEAAFFSARARSRATLASAAGAAPQLFSIGTPPGAASRSPSP